MSDQNPYERLGVTEDASFDEIQDAKSRLRIQHQGDQKHLDVIEAAYDAIIMERLRMRQQGKIKVPERIRFPEKLAQTPPTPPPAPINSKVAWLQGLLDTPSVADIAWPGGILAVLSAIVVFYQGTTGSILPLMMALGFGVSLYFLNRKEKRFGRSLLLTLAGLLVGVSLGSWLGGLVEAQISVISLAVEEFATLVTFVLLWLVSSFLK